MPDRIKLGASLPLLLVFLCGAASVHAAEALRDASFTAIALRHTRTVETRGAVLSKTFDASRARPVMLTPTDARKAVFRKKNWFIRTYKGLPADQPFRVPDLKAPPASSSLADSITGALRASMRPWRRLLDYAWGGVWQGMTPIRTRFARNAKQ